jgi:hypothetical protein
MTDALAISRGPNEGAAAVLGRGSFQDFSKDVLAMRYKEAQEEKLKGAQVAKILQDNVDSKFASDNVNYFQPKMQEIRDYTIDLFKKNKGKLSELDVFEVQSKWNKLKAEAEASNNIYKEELDRVKQIGEDPQGEKWDTEVSANLRNLYQDPYSNPELRKQVEDAGGIVKWRIQNHNKFSNIPAYSIEKDYQESFGKDKLSSWYEKEWTDKGDFLEKKGYKGIAPDPEKFSQRFSEVWGRNDYKGKKFKNYHRNWVENNFDVTEQGIAPQNEAAKSLLEKLPELKGATPKQVKERLAFEHGLRDTEARFPTMETAPLTQRKRDITKIDINSGSGAGGAGVGDITESAINAIPGRELLRNSDVVTDKSRPVTSAEFTTSPFKVTRAFSPEDMDIQTGGKNEKKGVREIAYGQMKVMPVAKQDIEVKTVGGATDIIKKGSVITDEEMDYLRVHNKKNLAKYDVYAVGFYSKKGEALNISINNPDDIIKYVNQLGDAYNSILTPANVVKNAALDAASAKDKEVFNRNYRKLMEIANEKNGNIAVNRDAT